MDEQQLFELRRALHQIPELGFQEKKTQERLLTEISKLPQTHLEVQTWETGVLVRVQGSNPTETIGYRADIDGLPIKEETGFPFTSQHDGKMHACGHDFHMTIAIGVLSFFASQQPENNLVFVFQPAEEGPGGAKPMLESELFQAWRPDKMIALHIAPEYEVGTIATRPGLLFANTSELFIDFYGKGGHAATPHQANDMVVAASHFVTQLQTIVSRNVSPLDSAVVTIGTISGGTKQNIIAEHARVEGTIRTLSQTSMQQVKERIESLLSGMEVSFSCETKLDYGANYLQVYNHEEETNAFLQYLEDRGDVDVVVCREAMTGEDFGYFLDEIPGLMFWLGVHSEYGLHSSKLDPQEEAISQAVKVLTGYLS
ncbi:N-acetyldiaminopimelate deacetylase [Texcoconibacillus texcoconensis]|nr:N-acetyldiaminopimelate deacetylase [Texcoconibacillus texcoconensis]